MPNEYSRTELDAMATRMLDIAFAIHRELGPGLLESVYVRVLLHELARAGFSVRTEGPVPLIWDGEDMGVGFRADIIVNNAIVLEIKATEGKSRLFAKQLLTYLKLLDCRPGYVINFNQALLKNGIVRVANNLE